MRAVLRWFGTHVVGILVAIALFALVMAIYDWHHHPAGAAPEAKADAIRVDTVTRWKLVQDTVTVRVDHFVRDTRKSAGTGRTAAARLDSAAVSVVDTSPAHAYAMERERGDTLQRLSLDLSVALDTMTADRDRWRLVADTSVALLNHLQQDLEVAVQPCRIVGFIPCPSRKVVAVGAVLATLVAVNHFTR